MADRDNHNAISNFGRARYLQTSGLLWAITLAGGITVIFTAAYFVH